MLLMWTNKTAVCLHTNPILHHLHVFLIVVLAKFHEQLPIALTGLLDRFQTLPDCLAISCSGTEQPSGYGHRDQLVSVNRYKVPG